MRFQIIALLIFPCCCQAEYLQDEDDSDDPNDQDNDEPLLKLPMAGDVTKKLVSLTQPVTLTCGKQGVDLVASSIAWFYKPCGMEASDKPCDPLKDIGGRKMCRGIDDDPCPSKLVVDKPQPGLYRCYRTGQKSGYTMTATLVNTYQLEIIERKLEPEFVEVPEDVEAFAGSTALFMCRIKSLLPLHVKWYKQVPKAPMAIQYESKYYQGLNGTNSLKNGDVYLSKLKFKNVALDDSGVYACGAVNEAGIQYRKVRLIVIPVAIQSAPRAPPGPWKMVLFGSAGGFLIILMTSLCCVRLGRSSCGCKKSNTSPSIAHGLPRRHHPPRQVWPSEPETSDYEHVVTL